MEIVNFLSLEYACYNMYNGIKMLFEVQVFSKCKSVTGPFHVYGKCSHLPKIAYAVKGCL